MNSYVVICTAVLLVMFSLNTSAESSARYDHYRLYEVTIDTEDQNKVFQTLEEKSDSYTFLRRRTNSNPNLTVIVAPHKFSEFTELIKTEKLNHQLLVSNVQSLIEDESLLTARSSKFGWTAYHDLDSINEWLDDLAVQHPEHVSPIEIGETYEGRKIRGVKISFGTGKPGVFIEGGIHAREWIAPAFVTYLANALLTSKIENVRYIAENYDWYLVPSTNPDGYAYTHNRDRFWRKTRKPYGGICYGADPNRNWDFHWGEQSTSTYPCSDIYGGPEPFSEPETRAYAEFLRGLSGKIHAFIGFHSYSQLILFPYGHTSEHAPNHNDLLEIGTEAAVALERRYGTKYEVGPIYHTIYPASGASADYAYGVLNISVAFTYELRPANGRAGFELPAEQIIPTCEETLDSVVAMLEGTQKRGYFTQK